MTMADNATVPPEHAAAPPPTDVPSSPNPPQRPESTNSGAATTLVAPPEGFMPLPAASAPSALPTLGNPRPESRPASTSLASPSAATPGHVHFPLALDTGGAFGPSRFLTRSDTALTNAFSPMRRRPTRVGTFKAVEDFEEYQARPGWRPGAEPGVDPNKSDGGHASMPQLSARCDVTVVDFSQDNLAIQHLDNDTLPQFLKRDQPDWVQCRWINVNGLSWDVIQALGQYKKLHKLAIEDIMNTRNRTKAEWFPNHAFIVLTLQKLVHLVDNDDEDSYDGEKDDAASWTSGRSGRSHRAFFRPIRKLFQKQYKAPNPQFDEGPKLEKKSSDASHILDGTYVKSQPTGFSDLPEPRSLRTLQRYHASPNEPRTAFFEKHSSLAPKALAVACEQVSIFVTIDNTIISFFELSALDVELPIIRRLQTPDTILRQSCDASMVCQAIIDAIIDLAIPVTACYADTIGDLELDVLTKPNVSHTKKLYVIITEINKMLSFITPITNLITALRDHRTELSQAEAIKELRNPKTGVIITPMTYVYLGDVLDHCVLITDGLGQIKASADNMIDLIFNTVSAYQNESMKQLTVSTIIFLPLTFLTGYFGQNFDGFPDIHRDLGINLFWIIAVPVTFVVVVILMRDIIWENLKVLGERRHIAQLRKHRFRRQNANKPKNKRN